MEDWKEKRRRAKRKTHGTLIMFEGKQLKTEKRRVKQQVLARNAELTDWFLAIDVCTRS